MFHFAFHPGYSSEIDMAFNVGGAIPDSSWVDQGEVPIASMQCWNEVFAPYGVGNIMVPTTGAIVVEGMGSLVVQQMATEFGNNDVFGGMSIELNDSWYGNEMEMITLQQQVMIHTQDYFQLLHLTHQLT